MAKETGKTQLEQELEKKVKELEEFVGAWKASNYGTEYDDRYSWEGA